MEAPEKEAKTAAAMVAARGAATVRKGNDCVMQRQETIENSAATGTVDNLVFKEELGM